MPKSAEQQITRRAEEAAAMRKTPKEPLTWSEALADAPWRKSMPAEWETAYRRAYAAALVEREMAKPAARAGASGASQSDEGRAARGIGRITLRVAQDALDSLEAEARRVGTSKAKLFELWAQSLGKKK